LSTAGFFATADWLEPSVSEFDVAAAEDPLPVLLAVGELGGAFPERTVQAPRAPDSATSNNEDRTCMG
jgi:hypothetical protein